MSVLIDTNVLLRRTQPSHSSHETAVESIARLLAADERLFCTLQNISEFWNVATRPVANNGLGFHVDLVLTQVETIERFVTILPDTPAMYAVWKRLVVKHKVTGVKVHDARLVAAMNTHGVRRLLTFDVHNFERYEIEVIDPTSIVGLSRPL